MLVYDTLLPLPDTLINNPQVNGSETCGPVNWIKTSLNLLHWSMSIYLQMYAFAMMLSSRSLNSKKDSIWNRQDTHRE